jgi:hypothetical protein
MPPSDQATHAGKPDDKAKKDDETDPNAGPQEKAAEEAKAKQAAAPKAPPDPEPPPPPTFKDANGNDVAVGDIVTVKGTIESVSADDPSHGGNVSIVTDHPISATSTEKDHFNVRTAVVEGGGPAPGKDAKKASVPPGGSTAPQHTAPPPSQPPHTPGH